VIITRRINRQHHTVATNSNGTIRPGIVLVNGVETALKGGSFYLNFHEAGRRIRQSVGTDATKTANAARAKERDLVFQAKGGTLIAPAAKNRQTLAEAAAEWLEEISLHKKPATYVAYEKALQYFLESCGKMYVSEVDRKDMLQYSAFLRDEKGHSPRSVFNRFKSTMGFLKSYGVKGLVRTEDWPRYTATAVETYSKEDLAKLFAVCEPDERLFFEFLLVTGFRKQEAEHAEWDDINWQDSIITVRWKATFGWQPKAYKERDVPLPASMLNKLTAARLKARGALIFHLNTPLRRLKAAAVRAGLDPSAWWLHKFRASFATEYLRDGEDVMTVSSWLGHGDLASTRRYLSVAKGAEVRARVDSRWA